LIIVLTACKNYNVNTSCESRRKGQKFYF